MQMLLQKEYVFLPRPYSDKPAMIVELKYDNSAEGAISQIKRKQYTGKLGAYKENRQTLEISICRIFGCPKRNRVFSLGMNSKKYDSKSIKHLSYLISSKYAFSPLLESVSL